MPEVSVVIPLYNKAPYIETALRSVQTQSFADLEVIVVDDGSSDGGAALVAGFDDDRMRLIRQENGGAGAARNRGIAAAQGRWVAFLDADDRWRPDKLARQLHVLEAHPDVVWAGGAYIRISADGRGQSSPAISPGLFATEGVLEDALASFVAAGGAVWTSTVMVRRDALSEVGAFDPTLRVGQDTDLWVRLAVRHPRVAYVQDPIADRHEVAGSLTAWSRAEGFSTAAERARRCVAIAKELPPRRAALVRTLARQNLDHTARREFLAGRAESGREVVSVLSALELGAPSWRVRIAAHAPDPMLLVLLNAHRAVRRLQSWADRRSRARADATGVGAADGSGGKAAPT